MYLFNHLLLVNETFLAQNLTDNDEVYYIHISWDQTFKKTIFGDQEKMYLDVCAMVDFVFIAYWVL